MELYYDFKECECVNLAGELITIPAGRHVVAETDVVSVQVGDQTFDLDKTTFKLLRTQKIVNTPLL